ncbi:MAG: hypothetical protein HKN51_01530 [Saprospiraceae bacterium]|nr:hypothetical protein [Saprospiraceae bacterium]
MDALHYDGMTPNDAYSELTNFIDYLTDLFNNNTDLNTGQIAELKNYP